MVHKYGYALQMPRAIGISKQSYFAFIDSFCSSQVKLDRVLYENMNRTEEQQGSLSFFLRVRVKFSVTFGRLCSKGSGC